MTPLICGTLLSQPQPVTVQTVIIIYLSGPLLLPRTRPTLSGTWMFVLQPHLTLLQFINAPRIALFVCLVLI